MIIRDVSVLGPDMQVHAHREVHIREGRYTYIGACTQEKEEGGRIIDGRDRLLMPGFYNVHCHVPMTLLRGLGEGLALNDWLTKKIFPFEAKLTADDCYYGTLLGAMELISSGSVSISDMYFFINDMARALDEAGMKANLCHGISCDDPQVNPESLTGWQDTIRLMDAVKKGNGRIRVDMGLHAEYTSNERLVRAVAAFAKENGLRIHTHISETKSEHEGCKGRHGGLSPVRYFQSCGIFDNPVLAAHCVWLEKEDRRIIKESGGVITHCPSSNLKLASGIADIPAYLKEGLRVALGTDGASSNNNLNMMEEMHIASLLAKGVSLDPCALPVGEVIKMATVNGALSQGRDDCGYIAQGMCADGILLDLDKPHLVPPTNLLSHVVYSAQASDISMTIIDGRIVYENGEFPFIDRERVVYEVKRRTQEILNSL